MSESSSVMPEKLEISSSTGSYEVHIEPGSFARCLQGRESDIVLADQFFADILPPLVPKARATIFIEATEPAKSLDTAPALIEQMRRAGANRQTQIVSIGGGVLQDISTFAASVYMRGVKWIYIPTTVLGMVDSCIGGKSSINVGPYKNLVGTYHPPQTVFIDPEVIRTLPLDQQASGIIEAAKICFCRGHEAFERYLACDPRPGMAAQPLGRMIGYSLRAKKWFIEIDEFDQKERLLLNFGHTFGHAIEGASHYTIAHGIAVGLGILCALEFSRQRAADPTGFFAATPIVAAFEQHLNTILESAIELRDHLAKLSIPDVMERLESDKKHKQTAYVLILVDAAGAVILEQVPKSPASAASIERAITSVIERYSA